MARHLALLLLLCGTAVAAEVDTVRVTPFDFQAQDSAGAKLSDHARFDTAIVACLNNPACEYVQGGRYRITKKPAATVPTARLMATAASILPGTSIELTWDCGNATSAKAGGAWGGALALSGTLWVTPPATGTYSVTCTGPQGSSVVDVLVQVTK